MIYPAAFDILPLGLSGESRTEGALIDGRGTSCGLQAQRDEKGSWRIVDVVVAMGWDDSDSGQSRLVAFGAAH